MPGYLDFDFATAPFRHQLRELEDHADAVARAKLWTMRTGKSKASIDKAFYLFGQGVIDAVLIVAPNGVHANWVEREFPIHAWRGVAYDQLVWRSSVASAKAGRGKGRDAQLDWAIERDLWYGRLKAGMKTDSLFVMAIATETMIRKDVRQAVARLMKWRKVYLIVDESDDFGTPGSTRTKMIRSLARKATVREILSGTSLTGNPLAAWSQFEILEKGALGFDKFADFKWHYGVFEQIEARGRTFSKLVDFRNLDDLRERISKWSSVVLREDTDMPDLVFDPVRFVGTPEQNQAYEELRESFILDLESGQISVGERASRLQKMQQVFSGFVNDDSKKRHVLKGGNPRLDATAHQCFLAPGNFFVWCEFQADIDFVTKRLRADGMKIVEYHGRVSDKQKSANLKAFNSDESIDGFVGHVQAGGRGLDMSVASTIINHSHTFKARFRVQSLDRASKMGGGNIRVVDIIGPGPDRYILKTTSKRININDSVAGSGLKKLLEGMGVTP